MGPVLVSAFAWTGTLNTIDLVAIVPFYVELLLGSAEGSGYVVARVCACC